MEITILGALIIGLQVATLIINLNLYYETQKRPTKVIKFEERLQSKKLRQRPKEQKIKPET